MKELAMGAPLLHRLSAPQWRTRMGLLMGMYIRLLRETDSIHFADRRDSPICKWPKRLNLETNEKERGSGWGATLLK